MGYCVASGGNLIWVIVLRVVVIFMGFCVASGVHFLPVVWRLVAICYELLCGDCW